MKAILLALLGSLAFTFLCYDREPGLNVFLISLITLSALFYERKGKGLPWFFMGAYLYTGIFTFLNPWDGAILVHVMSFVVLCGALACPERTSVYLLGIIGGTNLPAGMFIGRFTGRKTDMKTHWTAGSLANILGGITLSALLMFVFASLYASSNPLFEKALDSIDLGFIGSGWFWFTILGFLLYFNLLNPYDPDRLLALDRQFSDNLSAPGEPLSEGRLKRLKQENLWGTMTMSSLNALLIFYLALDWIYLGQQNLQSPASQSEAVHAGVEALIFSIVLAMGLLLIFFRGDLNYFTGKRWLCRLSLFWLALNGLLLFQVLLKNSLYVYYSGLTGKRLGVFLFLILVGIGLGTVLLKIQKKRSLMFLIRRNSLAVFMVLTGCIALPWGPMITAYNLRALSAPDLEYLLKLPNDNSIQLQEFVKAHPDKVTPEQRQRISERYRNYTEAEAARNWREWNGYHLFRAEQKQQKARGR
jgi:hypothetical protein